VSVNIWQLSNSLTFPGFPTSGHPVRIYISIQTKRASRCVTARLSQLCQSADLAYLKWPQRRLCKGFKFHGCWRERDRWQEIQWTCGCTYVWKSVVTWVPWAYLQHHYNEKMRPATASCSHWLCRPKLQCSETGSLVWAQESAYTWTSALRRQTTRHKRQCRRQATHDTRLQRQLPPSFPGCPAGHPRSGSQTLRVVQAHYVWSNVISWYSTSRTLILECENDSLTSLVAVYVSNHMSPTLCKFFCFLPA